MTLSQIRKTITRAAIDLAALEDADDECARTVFARAQILHAELEDAALSLGRFLVENRNRPENIRTLLEVSDERE